MPLEKGGKSMETKIAKIKRSVDKATLIFIIKEQELEIVLTEDNPNEIKKVFNTLLKELRTGLYSFDLNDTDKDLYHDISVEYIKQLNVELKTVHGELLEYGLIENA
jgi:hypothetical protein